MCLFIQQHYTNIKFIILLLLHFKYLNLVCRKSSYSFYRLNYFAFYFCICCTFSSYNSSFYLRTYYTLCYRLFFSVIFFKYYVPTSYTLINHILTMIIKLSIAESARMYKGKNKVAYRQSLLQKIRFPY